MPWKSSKAVLTAVVLSTLLVGCTSGSYDGPRAPDPTKAIIVGSIVEGYLTQPHGLMVHIRKPSASRPVRPFISAISLLMR